MLSVMFVTIVKSFSQLKIFTTTMTQQHCVMIATGVIVMSEFNSEYIAYSRYDYIEKQKRIVVKKASQETITKRIVERNYTKRSNICDRCFVAKSIITGECNC